MTKMLKVLVALCAFSGLASEARAESADRKAFAAMMDKFVAAWNRHDPKALAAQYTEDGALTDPFGGGKGRAGVEKEFVTLMTGPGKASTTTAEITHFEPIKGNYALVELLQTVTGLVAPDGKTLPPTKFSIGCLASKKGAEWLLRYCHVGMLPPPPPPAKG